MKSCSDKYVAKTHYSYGQKYVIVGIKFDKIASKLHFKYYYDGFYFDEKTTHVNLLGGY